MEPCEEIGAGHADAEHVLRAKSIGGNGGDERGVDAAAERDEGFAEAAFAHIVARAENQGAIGGLGVVFKWIEDLRPIEGIDDHQVFFETIWPGQSARRGR